MSSVKGFLTLTEFAKFIKNKCGIEIKASSLRRYIMQGKISGLQKIGYMWVVNEKEAVSLANLVKEIYKKRKVN